MEYNEVFKLREGWFLTWRHMRLTLRENGRAFMCACTSSTPRSAAYNIAALIVLPLGFDPHHTKRAVCMVCTTSIVPSSDPQSINAAMRGKEIGWQARPDYDSSPGCVQLPICSHGRWREDEVSGLR